jgi:predicted esterase
MITNLHSNQPILTQGADLQEVQRLVLLFHGRGARAESVQPLASALDTPGTRFLMPQAGLNRWYPNTAFGPLEANQPDLDYALASIDSLVNQAQLDGYSDQQIYFGGFSQGACLAAEYVARNPRRYGGLFVFSGALIGPPGIPRSDPGDFEGMPVFIGGSDVDPWVSHDWMAAAAHTFERMGAAVDFRTYPGMAHTINQDEIEAVRGMLSEVVSLKSQ